MHEALSRAEQGLRRLRAARKDRWYPAFHIAGDAGWINDPNGVSYYKGRYHVFFQHHPYSAEWGPIHWGHVSSADMVTWRREPIAFAPGLEEDRDGVFSGSAVVSDDDELMVYFTGHRWRNGVNEEEGNLQVQCMAVSTDGIEFEKKGVIVECPEGLVHFRDPKVWRMGDTWYMILGACSAASRGEIWLYTSTDMRQWEFDRVLFQDPSPNVFMLECPDLFPLGDKWVIVYGPMGAKPDGYQDRNSGNTGYVVGNWAPGQEFEQLTGYRPLDWGGNYYAAQSFEAPDGRRIIYAWMGSFTPIASQADDGWCGQLTVPRELVLGGSDHVISNPVAELTRLRTESTDFGECELGVDETKVLAQDIDAAEVEIEVDLRASTGERIGLAVNKTPDGHETLVAYDDLAHRVILDRRNAGAGDRGYRGAPVSGDTLRLRVLIDRASVEVFVNDGMEAVSSLAFPAEGPRSIELYTESGTAKIDRLVVHRLRPMWEGE